MLRFTFLFLVILNYTNANIFFPDSQDSSTESTPLPGNQPIQHMNSNIRQQTDLSKSSYSRFVDDIIAHGVTNLCLAIDRSIANSNINQAEDYIVYSPLSIASALSLVLLGSHGKTFEELSTLLGLAHGLNIANYPLLVHEQIGALMQTIERSQPQDTQMIKFANGIFIQNDFPIRNQYKTAATSIYQSEIMNLDFKNNPSEARNIINKWVTEKTYGKIDGIISEDPNTETKAVFVSSLYFKSDWDNPFDTSLTKLSPYYSHGKNQPSSTKVNLMVNGGDYPYHNDSILNCQIVGLPYKGKTTTFYLVIPHNSNQQKLRDLENRLTASEMKRLVTSTKKMTMLVALPKMKLTSTLQLQQPLQNLGLNSLFNPKESNLALLSPGSVENNNTSYETMNRQARDLPITFTRRKRDDTRKILGREFANSLDSIRLQLNVNKDKVNPGLYADQILHKVYVDVNEKGTEATAATGVSLTRDGNRIVMKADVPFFFFIYHEETNTVLFWGSVNTPAPQI